MFSEKLASKELVIREYKVNNLVGKLLEVIESTTTLGKLLKKVVIIPPEAKEEEGEYTIAEVYLALAETIAITSRMYGKVE